MISATALWLLVVLVGPPLSRPDIKPLYETKSRAACEAQKAAWLERLKDTKAEIECLPHNGHDLNPPN